MVKKRLNLILLIVCCLVSPILGKDFGFQEFAKVKYSTDTIHSYRHIKSGFEMTWVENKDTHYSFMLGVRTPTYDSTGVNHIIEHTLFTGSKAYPSSSLFFDANEAYPSLYMNALTSGDMTCFPFCTPYLSCFEKLMDIYLDAIFAPNFLNQPYGFYEESFYYLPEENRSGGVVYNEMKGAYSSTERTIFRSIRETIYEGTHYAYDSGGNPNKIPALTYDTFLDTYQKHYYPANMKLVVYGDLPIEKIQGAVAKYLEGAETHKKNPISLKVSHLSNKKKATHKVLPSDKGCTLVKAFVLREDISSVERQMLELWMNAYLMNSESRFQRLLESKGIFQARWMKDDDVPYPVYALVVTDLKESELDKASAIIDALVDSWPVRIEPNLLLEQDVVAQANWSMLKQDSDTNRGISIGDSIIEGWAHGRSEFQYYEKKNELEKMKKIDANIQQVLWEASRYTISLLPGETEVIAPETVTPIAREKWSSIVRQMKEWQQQKIGLESVDAKEFLLEPKIKHKITQLKDYTQLELKTKDQWARSQVYFNTSHIAQEKLPYLFLYSRLIDECAEELTPFSGTIDASCIAYPIEQTYWPALKLSITTQKKEKNHVVLLEQVRSQLITRPASWYQQKLKKICFEMKKSSENNAIGTLAQLSLGTGDGMKQYLYQQSYPFYDFCNKLLDSKTAEWMQEIYKVDQEVYQRGGAVIAVTLPKRLTNPYKKHWEEYMEALPLNAITATNYNFHKKSKKSIVESNASVDYIYRALYKDEMIEGVNYLTASFLTKNYLNPHIRVALGAYGTGCQAQLPHTIGIYTYRDPDYRLSLEVINKIPEFLSKPIDEKAIENSKTEALNSIHVQYKLLGTELEKANTLEQLYLYGKSDRWLVKIQEEVIRASRSSLKEQIQLYKKLINEGSLEIMTSKKIKNLQDYTIYNY